MVATRFAVAIHILLLLASRRMAGKATSEMLARSVNTNPVVVRRITAMLGRAGLIRVRRGPGGAALARCPDAITLGDVWQAMNPASARPLLTLHATPDQDCPIGREVHTVLGGVFLGAEQAMHQALCRTSLAALLARMEPKAA